MSIEADINNYNKKFQRLYNLQILPLFKEYEIDRKKTFIKFWLYLGLFLVLTTICGCFWAIDRNGLGGDLCPGFALICILGAIVVPSFISDSFSSDIKSECIEKVMSVFGNIKWRELKISDYEMKQSELFKDFAGSNTDDFFSGTYREVPFKVTELYTYTDSGSTIFKGVVLSFKVNKIAKNKTIIASKTDFRLQKHSIPYLQQIVLIVLLVPIIISCFWALFLVPLFTKIILLIMGLCLFALVFALFLECKAKFKSNFNAHYDKNMKQVTLEDPEFSKKYKVYSSDQIEGRYLITPGFMERFKNMQTAFGTKNIKCSFYGDSLMFAISTRKNLFEIGNLFYSLENPKQLQTFFNELTSIFILIDYFKLNEKTGL